MDIFKEPKLPVRTVKKFRNPFSGFIGERQNADQVGPLLWTKRIVLFACIVATGALREPRDYSAASVIHPAIGVRMERTRGYRGGLRPQVPQNVIRLRDMWQAALVARDSDSS